jgi:RNA polymerase sigma factor (sigma-70 family)
MSDDTELLHAYLRDGSETAFRELVVRHVPFVLAAARRIVGGDEHLAQDVAQMVFADLAAKAALLPPGVILGGWLHRHTCFSAAKAVRAERRRRVRERTAMELNTINESSAQDSHWLQLAPVLDEALLKLTAVDRDAIILRYFERHDMRAIGEALGITRDAAQKRVLRALDRLRAILAGGGVTFSSALLAAALDGAAVPPVSGVVSSAVSAAALDKAATLTWFSKIFFIAMSHHKKITITLVLLLLLGSLFLFIKWNTANSASPVATAQTAAAPKARVARPTVATPVVAPAGLVKIAPPAGTKLAVAAPPPEHVNDTTEVEINAPPDKISTKMTVKHNPDGSVTYLLEDGATRTQPPPRGVVYNGDGTRTVTKPSGEVVTEKVPPQPVKTVINPDGTYLDTMPDGSTDTGEIIFPY